MKICILSSSQCTSSGSFPSRINSGSFVDTPSSIISRPRKSSSVLVFLFATSFAEPSVSRVPCENRLSFSRSPGDPGRPGLPSSWGLPGRRGGNHESAVPGRVPPAAAAESAVPGRVSAPTSYLASTASASSTFCSSTSTPTSWSLSVARAWLMASLRSRSASLLARRSSFFSHSRSTLLVMAARAIWQVLGWNACSASSLEDL
mmetsp:Transcript_4005/g.5865  ORF Transcript_4005/g.5865 Transcript_4005/m.5865 type:complete len:204 (-) Transcript_4005:89-700(-)